MRVRSKLIVLVMLAAAALAGCGKHNLTSPWPRGRVDGLPADFYRLWSTSYVDGAEFFSTAGDPESQLVTMDVDGFPVVAVLIKVGSRYVDGGTVRVGQSPPIVAGVDTLARRSVRVYGTPWYLYTSVPNLPALPPITFDGVARHRFRLTGSADVGAFEDSIQSVTRPTITAPAADATVPRSSNLVVSWSDAGNDTSVRVFGFVRSDVDSSIAPGVGDARDPDGHAIVDFAHAHLPAGSAWLTVIRYRVAHRTIGQLGVVLKCEGIVHRPLTLQ